MKHKTWGELLRVQSANGDVAADLQMTSDGRDVRKRRQSFLHLALLCAASLVTGLVTSQRGPTILSLGGVSHSSLQQTLSLFSLGAGGQLAGCLATGVAFGRFRTPMFIFWSLLALAATTAALPWCGNFGVMAGVYFMSLFCVGCVETGSYVDVAKGSGKRGERILQFLQLAFVVGGVLSPAFTQFFLSKHSGLHLAVNGHQSRPNSTNSSDSEVSHSSFNVYNETDNPSQDDSTIIVPSRLNVSELRNASHYHEDYAEDNKNVAYAYFITAGVCALVAVPFAVGYAFRTKKQHQAAGNSSQTLPHRNKNGLVLLLVGVFFFSASGVEESLQQMLSTYVIRVLQWTPHTGALLTAWLWCGSLMVRIAALLARDMAGETFILTLSCLCLPASLAGLHLSVTLRTNDGVWACVFFAGMAASLIYPSAFAWMHRSLRQSSGALSAVVMLSSTLAGVCNPLLVGYFLQRGWQAGFPLLLLAEAGAGLLGWVGLWVVSLRVGRGWLEVPTDRAFMERVIPGPLEEVGDTDTENPS